MPPKRWQDWLYADERQARALLQPFDPKEFTAKAPPRQASKPTKEQLAKDDPAA